MLRYLYSLPRQEARGNAYTIFAKIFMHDPRTVKYTCGMGEEISADMKEAAYKAVFEEQPIPDGYKVKTK